MTMRYPSKTFDEHAILGVDLYAARERFSGHLNRYPKASRFTRACWSLYRGVDMLRSALDGQASIDLRDRFSTRLYYPGADLNGDPLAVANHDVVTVLAEFASAHLVGGPLPRPAPSSLAVGRSPLSFAEHRLLGLDRTLFAMRIDALMDRFSARSSVGNALRQVGKALDRIQLALEQQASGEPGTCSYAMPLYWHSLPTASATALNRDICRVLTTAVGRVNYVRQEPSPAASI